MYASPQQAGVASPPSSKSAGDAVWRSPASSLPALCEEIFDSITGIRDGYPPPCRTPPPLHAWRPVGVANRFEPFALLGPPPLPACLPRRTRGYVYGHGRTNAHGRFPTGQA